MSFRLKGLLFFPILFLIGFGFSLLTHIPPVQRFLLRSRAFRVVGLLLLAMLAFLAGIGLTSRDFAEFSYWYITVLASDSFMELMGYGTPDPFLEWVIPNKPSIIKELWIESFIPALSKENCFSSDPMVCKLVQRTRFLRESLPFFYAMALIPAFITFGLGWRKIRRASFIDSGNNSLFDSGS